jgi:hypothetical protein
MTSEDINNNTTNDSISIPQFDLKSLEESPLACAAVRDFFHPHAQLVPIAHKGLGIVATVAMTTGTLILLEHALATARSDAELERALLLTSGVKRDALEALYSGPNASFDVSGVVRFNSLAVEGEFIATANTSANERADAMRQSAATGVWIRASRFNHSCASAAHWNVIGDLVIVRLARDVAAGDEITISYHPSVDTFERTQRKLAHYGFECDCARCVAFRAHPEWMEAESQLSAKFDRMCEQFELRHPMPNPVKSLALADYLEQINELLPTGDVTTSIRFTALTCLAMLENNSGHFELAAECSRDAQAIAREFLGHGARVEIEVAMNRLVTLLLSGRMAEAVPILVDARDSFCRRNGVSRSYFRAAFRRYFDKLFALEQQMQVSFNDSILRNVDDDAAVTA